MNQMSIDRPSATRDALSHDELHDIDADLARVQLPGAGYVGPV